VAARNFIDGLIRFFANIIGDARDKVVNEPWFGRSDGPETPSPAAIEEADPAPAKGLGWSIQPEERAWLKWRDVDLDTPEPEQPGLDPQRGIDR
jgi:hypothetical protein